MTTLLERITSDRYLGQLTMDEVEQLSRAIVIAQSVEESANEIAFDTAFILRRADELLEGK